MTAQLSPPEIENLYERYAPVVYRRAYALLAEEDDAWDVVQQVFEQVIRSKAAFRREARPMTWIYRMTTNTALNLIRSKKTRGQPAELSEALPTPNDPIAAADARNLLVALSTRLDARAQSVAALHFVDGLTQEDIESVLALSRKTIGRVLQQVRLAAQALQRLPHSGGVS